MSQSSRPKRGRPAPRPSPVPAILSALIVVLVLVGLGLLLATNRSTGSTQTGAASTTESLSSETQPSSAAANTSPSEAAGGATSPSNHKTYAAPPPMTIDTTKNYIATITTPRGDIVIKLRPDLAPQTVNNFVFLAKDGFFNGVTWHRVIQNFMAQGGDPTGTGTGGPGYTIPDEFTTKVLFDKPGIVAMANTGQPNSGGSQFFITTAPYSSLDGKYTIFGEVVKGQEVVNGIPLRDPEQNPTTPGEKILSVKIDES